VRDDYRRFATLAVAQDGRVLTVELNRPGALNAVNGAMTAELLGLLHALPSDDSVGAVVLAGAGRAFCSGGDVREIARTAGPGAGETPASRVRRLLGESTELLSAILDVQQPIVAAVHGYALGLGATLTLFADVAIAAEDAVLADPHVDLGLVAGDGGAVVWPLLVPLNTAKYYLMTGDRITGADAARLGLVLRAVPAAEVRAHAGEVAARLAAGPPLAVRWTKAVLNKILRERVNLLVDASLLLEGASMLSEDHAEAVRAAGERRHPDFRGR
jgi:enoyl-CoA hydratase